MDIYPYSAPIILRDDLFVLHGGQTGTTPPAQRQVAYLLAEQQMTSYLQAYLLPTIHTGTWDYQPGQSYFATEYGYVSRLLWLKVLDVHGNQVAELTGTYQFGEIRNDTFGYIYTQSNLLGCYPNQPYKFQYAYESGLPTGVANQPGMLMALSGAAQLVMNELQLVPANESTGDVGVTEYTSLQYSEKRKMWKNTVFGSSPKAAWVAKLVDGTIKKARRAVMLGRM